MNPQDRMMRGRITLLMTEPFFGTLLLRLGLVEDASVGTMATDGKKLFWAPQFVENIPEEHLTGVLAHEVLHVANLHMLRRGSRDPDRWNIACDAVINHVLINAGFKLPPNGVWGPEWAWAEGLSAEEAYDRLPPDPPGAGAPGQVLDSPAAGEAERSMVAQDVKVAVAQAALAEKIKRKGNLPSWLSKMVEDICEAKIPWQDVLRRFFSARTPADYTWARPNRRFVAAGIYMPGTIKQGIGEGVVYVDTSGSCWSDRPQFWGEMRAIIEDLMPERVHVVQCDAGVGDFHTYEMGEPINLEAIGGGGSDFRPAFAAVEEAAIRPQWAVVLSDMEIDFPSDAPHYPVLMVSTTKKKGPEWAEEHIAL